MAPRCAAPAFAFCLALVTSAGVTIRWNTASRAAATPAPAPVAQHVLYGTVVAVKAHRVVLRLQDGTLRAYAASDGEAAALRMLLGRSIAFRLLR